jgi:hypothetical protein
MIPSKADQIFHVVDCGLVSRGCCLRILGRKIDQRPTVGLCSVSIAALGGSRGDSRPSGGQQVGAEAPLWLLAQRTSQHAGRSSRFCPAFDSEATRGSLVGPVWHACLVLVRWRGSSVNAGVGSDHRTTKEAKEGHFCPGYDGSLIVWRCCQRL